MSGMAIAIGIGLALGTGHGIAAADSSASDASKPAQSSDSAKPAGSSQAGSSQAKSSQTKSKRLSAATATATSRVHKAANAGATGSASTATVSTPRQSDAVSDDDATVSATTGATTSVASSSATVAAATTSSARVSASPLATAPTADLVPDVIQTVAKFVTALDPAGTTDPVSNPALWAVLAWARRELAEPVVGSPVSVPATAEPVAEASATSSTSAPVTTINIRDYGAVGDGVTDDSAAIKAAVAALTSGERLYIPAGDYRFAQQWPEGNAAIVLNGLSNVTVEFDPDARLLMDNLDANGYGTSNGITVLGAASNVTLINPTIEWVTRPSTRSFGDGISVLGWPSDTPPPSDWTGSTGTVSFVSIINGRVVNAPQAGAVIMGASDVTVTNFTAIGTLADGLHFNANRRVTLDGLVAQNTGDDGLAFVTYYDPTQPWTYGPSEGPFNQAGLGEWNNGGSVASHITVTGGSANGVRVQGGYDISISDVTVTDTDMGIQINSSIATGPGDWTSLASRDIHISDVTIDGAQTGIVLGTHNIDGTEDSKWWDFSGVTISDATILNSSNWSIAVETPWVTTSKVAGITLQNIYADTGDAPLGGGNGGMLLASLQDSVIDNVHLVSDHASDINLFGAAQIRSGVDVEDLPSSNLTVNDLVLEGPGHILIQDIAGVTFGDVSSYGADSNAVVLYRVRDASFDNITAYMPGRSDGYGNGVQLLQVFDLDIANITVTTDDHIGSAWTALELSGGNPDERAGSNVRIGNFTYTSDRDDTESHIFVQGGPYGAVDWSISAHWRHSGAAVPQWRSALLGDVSPL